MPLNVGDAVMSFALDLTNFEAALARINSETKAKLKPSQDAVEQFGASFEDAGKQGATATSQISAGAQKAGQSMATAKGQADALGLSVRNAGAQAGRAFQPASEDVAALRARIAQLEIEIEKLTLSLQQAGSRTGSSMRDARGEVALLGEAVGVKLPRHVRNYLVELPGVATAMESAFSATAVYFLIQGLIEGTGKLSDFIAATFIYTEAQKKANDAIIEQNKQLLELVHKTKELADARELATAKTPVERDAILLRQQARDLGTVVQVQNELNAATDRYAALQRAAQEIQARGKAAGVTDFVPQFLQKEIDELIAKIPLLTDRLKHLQEAEGKLHDEQGRDALAEQIKFGDARIASAKSLADALNELELQRGRLAISTLKINFKEQAELEQQFHEQQYQNEVKAISDRIANLSKDPTKNAAELAQLNAKLEAEEIQHEARMLKITADFKNKQKELLAQTVELLPAKLPDDVSTQQTQAVDKLLDAYKRLNLEGSLPLTIQLELQRAAMEALSVGEQQGLVTSNDLLRGRLKLIAIEIALAKARGQATAALEKEQREIQKQIGLLPKYGKTAESVAQAMGAAITSSAYAFGQGAITITQAVRQIAAETIKAIAAQAEIRGTAEMAEFFAEWPAGWNHLASAGLWFSLAGAVSAAAGAIAGGGSSASSATPGAPSQIPVTPATTPEQQPVQVANIQHLQKGGLVDRETLALVHPYEAVIPLGDERAKQRIADAFGGLLSPQTLALVRSPRSASRAAQRDEDTSEVRERLSALEAGQGGVTHIHNWNIEGVISSDNLHKVMKKMTREVNTGRSRLNANTSLRVTKRG